jgi:GTP-binding protein
MGRPPEPWRQAEFEISAAEPAGFPIARGTEIAFVGRSNAGKSSALNALCGQRGLARASRTPGRTQLVNFFRVDEDRMLVDLPGYGFAKVGVEAKRRWQALIGVYLESRENLAGVVLLMDIRHPLTDLDREMIGWCAQARIRLLLLLSKADKVSRGAAAGVVQKVKQELEGFPAPVEVLAFSATKGIGLEDALQVLNAWFEKIRAA